MEDLITNFNPDYIVYAGAVGVLLGLLFFIFYLYRRMRWIFYLFSKKKTVSPKLMASLRNLVLIMLWTSLFGMFLFFGFFLRAYHAFTYEKPVAEIITQPLGENSLSQVTLKQFLPTGTQISRNFLIRGDQWVIEGDVLKWDPLVNFLGLHTRYRLTRLRGRYLTTQDEVAKKKTIYSLVKDENHVFWRYLYRYGHRLPLINTVYGSAAFQASLDGGRYLIYVGISGFVVREDESLQP